MKLSRHRIVQFSALVGLLPAAHAQAPSRPPVYEVASIRRCYKLGGPETLSAAYLEQPCQPLIDLIRAAYIYYEGGHFHLSHLARTPILGGPAWIQSEMYAIQAKPETPQTYAMMVGPMMAALLEERFKLRVHREQRRGPAYELTLAKSGPRLGRFREDSCVTVDFDQGPPAPLSAGQTYCGLQRRPSQGATETAEILGWTLDDFSNWLYRFVGKPIINKTRLTGRFDFHLEYTPDPLATAESTKPDGDALAIPPDPTGVPSIVSALEQQLGLKLVPAEADRDYLIIDRVERPSEN